MKNLLSAMGLAGRLVPIVILVSPLFFLFGALFGPGWHWLLDGRLGLVGEYLLNSLTSSLFAVLIAIIIGAGQAWVLQNKKGLSKVLLSLIAVLPLSIPPFLASYTWSGFFDITGPINSLLTSLGSKTPFHQMPEGNLMLGLILGLSYSPYVFLSVLPALNTNMQAPLQSARTLGKKGAGLFFVAALPLLRPYLIASGALVFMESMSEFGAAQQFGANTLIVGLFRAWRGSFDLDAAIILGFIAVFVAAILVGIERVSRKKISFYTGATKLGQDFKSPNSLAKIGAFLIFLVPGVFALGLPLTQMGFWLSTAGQADWAETLKAIFNTLGMSATVGLFAILIALVALIVPRLQPKKSMLDSIIGRSADLSYAIPGIITALAVLIFYKSVFGTIVIGTSFFLAWALIVRYYAVGHSTLSQCLEHQIVPLEGPARTLGAKGFSLLRKIHLPLIGPSVLSAFILIALDVSKELTATYQLRPIGYETLATLMFDRASLELRNEIALPGLVLVAFSALLVLIAFFIIPKLERKSKT